MDFSEESVAKLSPSELVAALRDADPGDPGLRELDVDVLGRRIDPRKLSRREFVELLTALGRLADAGTSVDLSAMDPQNFARIIAKASGDQIDAAMADPALRGLVLDELFRRMTDHFIPERARDGRHVMHFRVKDGRGEGGYDHYVAVIEDRQVSVSHDVPEDAKTEITVGPTDMLRLATNNASPTFLYLRGKVRVKGSLGFATAFMSMFDTPKA